MWKQLENSSTLLVGLDHAEDCRVIQVQIVRNLTNARAVNGVLVNYFDFLVRNEVFQILAVLIRYRNLPSESYELIGLFFVLFESSCIEFMVYSHELLSS